MAGGAEVGGTEAVVMGAVEMEAETAVAERVAVERMVVKVVVETVAEGSVGEAMVGAAMEVEDVGEAMGVVEMGAEEMRVAVMELVVMEAAVREKEGMVVGGEAVVRAAELRVAEEMEVEMEGGGEAGKEARRGEILISYLTSYERMGIARFTCFDGCRTVASQPTSPALLSVPLARHAAPSRSHAAPRTVATRTRRMGCILPPRRSRRLWLSPSELTTLKLPSCDAVCGARCCHDRTRLAMSSNSSR